MFINNYILLVTLNTFSFKEKNLIKIIFKYKVM